MIIAGSIDDVGCGRGRYFCCNVPLKEGATDDTFFAAFDRCATLSAITVSQLLSLILVKSNEFLSQLLNVRVD